MQIATRTVSLFIYKVKFLSDLQIDRIISPECKNHPVRGYWLPMLKYVNFNFNSRGNHAQCKDKSRGKERGELDA